MDIKKLKNSLLSCYSKELCYYKVQDMWNEENKCLGMCAITALIVNDYFEGYIAKKYIDGVSHYFNIINGEIIDLTASQFKKEINYNNYEIIHRNIIEEGDTKLRYNLLKQRVVKSLLKSIDSKIHKCEECNNCGNCDPLVEKFPNEETVFLGNNNDIVLIGEAPANNGWRKSHKVWRDMNGKVLPSGIILQKLFNPINIDIFETTFLESVKCFPIDRKNLKICSPKCKNILLEQLEILKPKLIITLGEFPSRNLLDFKFNKFSDVVGNVYNINSSKIIPIYHPSPISPKSYNGNVPIIKTIADVIRYNLDSNETKEDDNKKNWGGNMNQNLFIIRSSSFRKKYHS